MQEFRTGKFTWGKLWQIVLCLVQQGHLAWKWWGWQRWGHQLAWMGWQSIQIVGASACVIFIVKVCQCNIVDVRRIVRWATSAPGHVIIVRGSALPESDTYQLTHWCQGQSVHHLRCCSPWLSSFCTRKSRRWWNVPSGTSSPRLSRTKSREL